MSDEKPFGSIGNEPTPVGEQNPYNTYSSDGYLMSYGSPRTQSADTKSTDYLGPLVTHNVGDGSPWLLQVIQQVFRKKNIALFAVTFIIAWLAPPLIGNIVIPAALLISSSVLRQMAARFFWLCVLLYAAWYVLFVFQIPTGHPHH